MVILAESHFLASFWLGDVEAEGNADDVGELFGSEEVEDELLADDEDDEEEEEEEEDEEAAEEYVDEFKEAAGLLLSFLIMGSF